MAGVSGQTLWATVPALRVAVSLHGFSPRNALPEYLVEPQESSVPMGGGYPLTAICLCIFGGP